MTDRFTDMLCRKLAIDWGQDLGTMDFRNHSLGIGGVNSMPAPKPVIEAAALLEPRLVRIFLQEFFCIYPDRGVYDWTKLDAYMDAVYAMGCDVMASICIKPKALYPCLDQSVWMPRDVAEWQEVIAALVMRYSKDKPYVTHWAIANEMNIGESGGCPYLIKDPDEYFEYYKLTAAPIRKALPGVKVGGPSYAGTSGAAEYLGRFAELCKSENIALDFTCYNMYTDDPGGHALSARAIKDAVCKHIPGLELYITEFNVGIGEALSLEEKAYDPKRAAGLAAALLALHENGAIDGSFQYHIYDQWHDPNEFASWFSRARSMSSHWNDVPHRLGLFDLDGKPRPQFFLYKSMYSMTGRRAMLTGADGILRGIASRSGEGVLSVLLVNYAEKGTPDAVSQIQFANAPEGLYRITVTRIDAVSAALMKASPIYALPPTENRVVYMHPDFAFDVYTPADTVTLIQLCRRTHARP